MIRLMRLTLLEYDLKIMKNSLQTIHRAVKGFVTAAPQVKVQINVLCHLFKWTGAV